MKYTTKEMEVIIPPKNLTKLMVLENKGIISKTAAKIVFKEMFNKGSQHLNFLKSQSKDKYNPENPLAWYSDDSQLIC